MRIDANSRVGAPSVRGAGRVAAGTGGSFAKSLDAAPPPASSAIGAATAVDGLLAFQEVEDATARLRRRAWQRGSDLLDRLDELKLGILDGVFSSDRLADLAQLARTSRAATQDPELDAVLGEIELRAVVEIAKLQRGI